jgi:SAM-dependent methyltransferase
MNNEPPGMDKPLVQVVPERPWTRISEGRKDVNGYQKEFVRKLLASPELSGRVLDIGCGGNLPPALTPIQGKWSRLDGVDPDPSVWKHPCLAGKWQCLFETCDIPSAQYDLAYAYNVIEHIRNPRPFFEKVSLVLKPGGVFWALTPNAGHLFAKASRAVETVGLKPLARRWLGACDDGTMRVNDYPAYYRCNAPKSVMSAIRGLPFDEAAFFYYPVLGWEFYFPPFLRWMGIAYDLFLGSRIPSRYLILIIKLKRR